jgi:deoxycytidylate deaminase
VRGTYPLADCFLDVSNEELLHAEASRFVEVLFSSPYQTPRRDEFGMFVAHAASLRSAALGRQVGASILDGTGAVIAVGTNEVPKAGGGQYWVNEPYDFRDHRYEDGSDSSDTMCRAIIGELLERYKRFGIEHPVKKDTREELTVDDLVPILKGTRIGSLVEFGRAVHAEMAAITDAARRGVSIAGGTLYSTTFPCHNCARHLVASGIREVVYVEPYAKSLAMNLHRDAIVLASSASGPTRIPFRRGLLSRKLRSSW